MKDKNKNQEKDASSLLICLAEITSPHGIKGAVKLKTFTESPLDITHYKELKDQAGVIYKFRILSTPSPHSLVISLQGVTDRNQAEKLRGLKLYVTRDELPLLKEEEEFYYVDLIGLSVIDMEGQTVGILHTVHNHGAGYFFDIMLESGEIFSIPFIKEAIPVVDIKAKLVTIDREFLLDGKV